MNNNYELKLIKKYIPSKKQAKAIKKLNKGYPIQYIIGNVEFYGLIIDVNKNVLIPRFETEYLVDEVIKLIRKTYKNKINILDIGTGSGCIALSLKSNLDCEVEALDISGKAIKVAKRNSKKNNLKIKFIKKDINKFSTSKKYDVIISNPPYVPLNSPVGKNIKYEPQNAIFAAEEGYYYYKIIFELAKNIINKKSIIAFEIGDNQGETLKNIASTYFPKSLIYYNKDLNNRDRYFFIINE